MATSDPPDITLASIPDGRGIPVEIDGRPIALFRSGAHVVACKDVCPHEANPMHRGRFEDGRITCPNHRWRFSESTGECHEHPGFRLRLFPVKVVNGIVRVESPR